MKLISIQCFAAEKNYNGNVFWTLYFTLCSYFFDLKILKLHDLFQLKLLSFVYESVFKISLVYFHNFYKSVESVHQYGTRQAGKDDIFPPQKITNGLRSIRYYGAKCWNDIPVEIKRSPSVKMFRQKLKTFLFEHNYWIRL